MHATALARELGMKTVVIPVNASVFSAMGMLLSDVRRDFIETLVTDLSSDMADGLHEKIADISRRATAQFEEDGVDVASLVLKFRARLRYKNQEHFVEVDIPSELNAESLDEVRSSFYDTYEREYTYRLDAPVELVALHCIATAKQGGSFLQESEAAEVSEPAPMARRPVDFDEYGILETSIYRGESLAANARLQGPAIIEEAGTTIVVFPGDKVTKDGFGNFLIEIGDDNG